VREQGTVVAVHDGTVDVRLEPSEACESCGACVEAATGGRFLEGVPAAANFRPGDRVLLDVPSSARRRALWLVYVVPVVALVAGYLAGFLLSSRLGINPDIAGAVTALACGAAALAWLPRASRNWREKPQVHAIIARGHGAYPNSETGACAHPPNEEDSDS
jgi:positive regulator of sigma E activity